VEESSGKAGETNFRVARVYKGNRKEILGDTPYP
jgi:hypothetical protein